MKRFILWLLGVAVGFTILLCVVAGVSFAFTTEGSKPASGTQFGGAELEVNGSCWQVPLIGGKLDKVFSTADTLNVQKLSVLYTAHPEITLPDWATYAQLSITNADGAVVFSGTADDYASFLYPANGEYKAELTVWRLPDGMSTSQFEGGTNNSLHKNAGLEHPAKAVGWYRYVFRFTLRASAELELSADKIEQGGIIGLRLTGMTGSEAPVIETDLGSIKCVRTSDGWRAYIPAAYNESAGGHEISVAVNGEVLTRTITVIPKDFGSVDVEASADSEAANTEFRNAIWPLYEQPAKEKLWSGGFVCPAENYLTLIDYGQTKVTNGKQGSRSNSTKLYTVPGDSARAPANGVVVLAQNLALTGNTVVIDHGCGMRSYIYGLASITVSAGQTVEKAQSIGTLGEDITMDFKLAAKV